MKAVFLRRMKGNQLKRKKKNYAREFFKHVKTKRDFTYPRKSPSLNWMHVEKNKFLLSLIKSLPPRLYSRKSRISKKTSDSPKHHLWLARHPIIHLLYALFLSYLRRRRHDAREVSGSLQHRRRHGRDSGEGEAVVGGLSDPPTDDVAEA